MNQTCPSCYSCGMPFKSASDYALGDVNQKFCSHCTNSQGLLKPYEEILSDTANYLVHAQGIHVQAALEMAKDLLKKQPTWRNHNV